LKPTSSEYNIDVYLFNDNLPTTFGFISGRMRRFRYRGTKKNGDGMEE